MCVCVSVWTRKWTVSKQYCHMKDFFPAAIAVSNSFAWSNRNPIHPHTFNTRAHMHACIHIHTHTGPAFAAGLKTHQLVWASWFTQELEKSPVGRWRIRRLRLKVCRKNNKAYGGFWNVWPLGQYKLNSQLLYNGYLNLHSNHHGSNVPCSHNPFSMTMI